MCHSYEMYDPGLARRAAEHRIGAADFAAAERERTAMDLLGRLVRLFCGGAGAVRRALGGLRAVERASRR